MTAAPPPQDPPGERGTVDWAEFAAQVPDLAAAVAQRFSAHTHLTMATLRADGAPRISGTEVVIHDGRMWLGAMAESMKVRDLRRDARVAIHSGSDDPPAWTGDAKVSGVAVEVVEQSTKDAYLAAHAARQAATDGGDSSTASGDETPGVSEPPTQGQAPADSQPAEPMVFALFEVRLTAASTVDLGEPPDHIVVTSWRPGRGLTRTERR